MQTDDTPNDTLADESQRALRARLSPGAARDNIPADAANSADSVQYKHSICSCARMEEDSIREWIDYHRSIGFDHFFIYGNDDDERVLAETLGSYIANRIVTFTHCPEVGAQLKMYLHFLRSYGRSSEWICFLDQDEYLRLPGFHDSVSELTSQAGRSFYSVQLNWLNFGTSGHLERPRGSVLRQYTRRAPAADIHTKHLTRSSAFFALPGLPGPFWHALPAPPVRVCSALLEPCSSFWDWIAATPARQEYLDQVARYGARWIAAACVAHFHLKSEQDFVRRIERGVSGNFANQLVYRDIAADPVHRKSFIDQSNMIEDRYLADYWESQLASLTRSNPRGETCV